MDAKKFNLLINRLDPFIKWQDVIDRTGLNKATVYRYRSVWLGVYNGSVGYNGVTGLDIFTTAMELFLAENKERIGLLNDFNEFDGVKLLRYVQNEAA